MVKIRNIFKEKIEIVWKYRYYRASGSEDASAHLQGASIFLDGVGCGITTAASTGEGWLITTADRNPDSIINKKLF
jgi:hypothetical protein